MTEISDAVDMQVLRDPSSDGGPASIDQGPHASPERPEGFSGIYSIWRNSCDTAALTRTGRGGISAEGSGLASGSW